MKHLFVCILVVASAFAQQHVGIGSTTVTCIDHDGDGYGTGPGCAGLDSDDTDANVHAAPSVANNWNGYGSLAAFINHLGYTPLHYWYIATTGNDSTCAKDDITKPCATFNKVRTVGISPDDAVLWRAGTYTTDGAGGPPIYLSPSGTSGHPILYMAYPGEQVIFDSAATATIHLCNDPSSISDINIVGFVSDNSDSQHLGYAIYPCRMSRMNARYLELKNHADGFFMMQDNHDVLAENIISHDMGNHTLYWGAQDLPNSNLTLQDSIFYNAGLTCMQHNGRVTNLLFTRNICYNYQKTGISLEQGVSGATITNNLVFNGLNKAFQIFDYPAPPASPNIQPYDEINNLVENNTFIIPAKQYTNGAAMQATPVVGVAIVGEYGALKDVSTGNTFRNNMMANYSAGGQSLLVLTEYATYDCYNHIDCTGSNYAFNGIDPATVASPLTWTNNLVSLTSSTSVMRLLNIKATEGTVPTPPTTPPASVDSLYTFSSWQSFNATTTNNVNSAPTFTSNNANDWNSPTAFNFLLAAGSAGINQGTSVGAPTVDIRNVARSVPDIGAYETAIQGIFKGFTIKGFSIN